MKSEPSSKQKYVSEEQLKAWCVLGESPILYAYCKKSGAKGWWYVWQLRKGVFWYAIRDKHDVFRPSGHSMYSIINDRVYSLKEIPDAAEW